MSGAHHATRDTGAAFCTFSFVVGSGRRLLDEGAVKRVMVVDLDLHQSNGTASLVADDDRFAVFDISGVPFGVKPVESERLFFRIVDDAESYFAALGQLPAMLDAFRPDLVQFLAGMDTFEEDSMGGVSGMNAKRLVERDMFVLRACRDRGVGVCISLAGGYVDGGVTVSLHLNSIRVASEVYT